MSRKHMHTNWQPPLIKRVLHLVQINIFCFSVLHELGGLPSGLQLEGSGVGFEMLFVCVGQCQPPCQRSRSILREIMKRQENQWRFSPCQRKSCKSYENLRCCYGAYLVVHIMWERND